MRLIASQRIFNDSFRACQEGIQAALIFACFTQYFLPLMYLILLNEARKLRIDCAKWFEKLNCEFNTP